MRQLRQIKRAGWATALLGLVLVTGGCEVDSWFDQSAIYRGEPTPIVQPIIENISIIEEDASVNLPTDKVRPEDLRPENREYIIGPGDTILVTVYELRIPGVDDNQQRRVTETGEVRLAIIGPIQAAGRSASQLERDIATKLDQDNKLRDATVSVQLLDSRQNTYTVFTQSSQGGTRSGTYIVPKPEFRLIEALTIANGIPGRTRRVYVIRQAALDPSVSGDVDGEGATEEVQPPAPDDPGGLIEGIDGLESGLNNAGPSDRPAPPTGVEQSLDPPSDSGQWVFVDGKWVQLESTAQDSSSLVGTSEDQEQLDELSKLVTQRIIEIPFQRLKDGDMRFNIIIRPGDVISVPDPNAGFVYVMGQIARPGAYTIPGEQELTLYRLIASAGGLTGLAWPEKVDLIRQINDKEQAIVRLDLRAIANGTEPDIYLKTNDVINIGTSAVAVPLAVFRNGLRTTYGFGFILDRNFSDDVFSD
ncbi:MAG: polysaccharide biosynthesis/export family protein [Planctomycetota bacterium]